MNKILTVIALCWLLVGCVTQKKAADWFDTHPEQDAQRCSLKYSVKDSIVVRTDSALYEQSIRDLMEYADSTTMLAYNRNKAIERLKKLADSLIEAHAYSESVNQQLADELNAIQPTDIPALTRSIEMKLRTTIKPCKDTTIYRENTARHVYDSLRASRLAVDSTQLAQLKHDKKNPGIVSGWLLTALLNTWWFWVVVALVAGFFTRGMWVPLLKKVPV